MFLRRSCMVYIKRNYALEKTWVNHHQPPMYKDYQASTKIPTTKEEHLAAAKKYNLLPEEYKPYAHDHLMVSGDYPELPRKNIEDRPYYYPWDMPRFRRNFGEPISLDFCTILYADLQKRPISNGRGVIYLLLFAGTFLGIVCFCPYYVEVAPPAIREDKFRLMPFYTFEPADGKSHH